MPTVMIPRWLLLKQLAMAGIDEAIKRIDELGLPTETVTGIQLHLGRTESTVEWMSEMLAHYKRTLDLAAIALHSVYQDGGYGDEENTPLEAAICALDELQSGYLDALWETNGKPGI